MLHERIFNLLQCCAFDSDRSFCDARVRDIESEAKSKGARREQQQRQMMEMTQWWDLL
jgi:hypothetical protein